MAKLEHANIVKCYGGNLEGSNPFIVTELCMCSLDKVRALCCTCRVQNSCSCCFCCCCCCRGL
jgi:hypothetical protein